MEPASGHNARADDNARTDGLLALPDELLVRVLTHLPSIRDFGRADCVCCAWHAGGSPVEQALRMWTQARRRAVPEALPVGAGSVTQRLCWLELLHAARVSSHALAAGSFASAVIDAQGGLCMWGALIVDTAIQPALFISNAPTLLTTMVDMRVQRVSLGLSHALVLMETGEVISYGKGEHGLLGHGDREDQSEPKVIEALRGVRVVAIAAGGEHSMVQTDGCGVLSFGSGEDGALGHGDEVRLEPTAIEALRDVRVVAMAAGLAHSMVLTDEGNVLSFGRGTRGQLGHGVGEHQYEPTVIEALRGTRVVAIAAGDFHSMVLTEEGSVLSFGCGYDGRLGHGDTGDQLVPKIIEALSDVRVTAIAAGESHSMVLTDEGNVLSFGCGMSGQLGHGDIAIQYDLCEPNVIEALRSVRMVR